MAAPPGIEPGTSRLTGGRSSTRARGQAAACLVEERGVEPRTGGCKPPVIPVSPSPHGLSLERPGGVEPPLPRWQRGVQPLDTTAALSLESGADGGTRTRVFGLEGRGPGLWTTPARVLSIGGGPSGYRSRAIGATGRRASITPMDRGMLWWVARDSNPDQLIKSQRCFR